MSLLCLLTFSKSKIHFAKKPQNKTSRKRQDSNNTISFARYQRGFNVTHFAGDILISLYSSSCFSTYFRTQSHYPFPFLFHFLLLFIAVYACEWVWGKLDWNKFKWWQSSGIIKWKLPKWIIASKCKQCSWLQIGYDFMILHAFHLWFSNWKLFCRFCWIALPLTGTHFYCVF